MRAEAVEGCSIRECRIFDNHSTLPCVDREFDVPRNFRDLIAKRPKRRKSLFQLGVGRVIMHAEKHDVPEHVYSRIDST